LRWDGLNGDQSARFSWRWNPSAEDLFLAPKGRDVSVPLAAGVKGVGVKPSWRLQPGDWAEFRGTSRDGVISGVRLATDWKSHPPRELWRHRVGPAWSSLVVVDGHVVTQEQRGEMEAVVAYNAATGVEEWIHEDKARFYEGLSGAGPRGTPTFADGRIFTLGATGRLNCLGAAAGERLWSHDVVAENGATLPLWGFSGSPLVTDGIVVIYAGGAGDNDLVAYRADSGDVAWQASTGAQSYSSPQLVVVDGVRQVVMQSDAALGGFNVADGELLWERPNGGATTFPMLQPHLVGGNRMLIPIEQGLVLVEVAHNGSQWSASDIWTTSDIETSFNDYAVYSDHIYGFKDGILRCVDLNSGKLKWKKGRYGHGQLMLVANQGALLVSSETGDVTLVAANPLGHEELAKFHAIDGKTWNHPVIAHGRLYARNDEEMACYELPNVNSAVADEK
jgi:outer membrane protein assembly factor BamB